MAVVVAFHVSARLGCNDLYGNLRASAGLGMNLRPAAADEDLRAMNVTIDVDLTPAEARELMGLPDVKPLHDAAMARVEQSVMAQAEKLSVEGLMNTWFAGNPGRRSFSAIWLAVCSRRAGPARSRRRSRRTQLASSKSAELNRPFAVRLP